MSIDASVVHGQRCTNFEIDGPQHFKEKKCVRNYADTQKDVQLANAGWGVMRLHHKDKTEWQKYIKHQMHTGGRQLLCTESYKAYLIGDHGEPTLVESGKL